MVTGSRSQLRQLFLELGVLLFDSFLVLELGPERHDLPLELDDLAGYLFVVRLHCLLFVFRGLVRVLARDVLERSALLGLLCYHSLAPLDSLFWHTAR